MLTRISVFDYRKYENRAERLKNNETDSNVEENN